MKSWKCLGAVLASLAAAACGEDSETIITTRNLDRPVDVAFGCAFTPTTPPGQPPPTIQVRPLADCVAQKAREYTPPALDTPVENLPTLPQDRPDPALAFYSFALESEPGSVAITRFLAINETWPVASSVTFLEPFDADPFQPGLNGVSIGTNPVAMASDRSGCFVISANGGSNDLSVLGVGRALDRSTAQKVSRVAVTGAGGAAFTARPAAMVAEDVSTATGATCPETPEGKVYLAYPSCQAVAVVTAATGAIESHISFATGAPVIAAGAPTCASDPALYRPATLDLIRDALGPAGERSLAIGGENSPNVTVVRLDASGLPIDAGKVTVTLEGDIGVVDVALSSTLAMGGSNGVPSDADDLGGLHQFVYAVATDASLRVASVTAGHECETQVDVRSLGDVTDPSPLSCLTPGDPSRPRRPGSHGRPGLRLVNDVAPTAVTIVSSRRGKIIVNNDGDTAIDLYKDGQTGATWDVPVDAPLTERRILTGTFAYLASSSGDTYIVNVDDDVYPDLESTEPGKELDVEMSQALPHQLRDGVTARNILPQATIGTDPNKMSKPTCTAAPALGVDTGGARLEGLITQVSTAAISSANRALGLGLRHVWCTGSKPNQNSTDFEDEAVRVPEMSYAASPAERAKHFPDIRDLPASTFWRFTWEGQLFDEARRALVPVDGTGMRLYDPAEPFCSLGAEVFDNVTLVGCDPARGDTDCGLGESCYVHPDAPSTQGACLPTKDIGGLAEPCKDFLISNRRYAVTATRSGELRLGERRLVLASTPITGCDSDVQCEQLAGFEVARGSEALPPLKPLSLEELPAEADRRWRCEADPSRPAIAGNDRRCVRHCTSKTDCPTGNICRSGAGGDGVCVEGVVPPLQCVRGLQRYQLRSTDAFTVTSVPFNQPTVYDHKIVEKPDGTCGVDPTNTNPYNVGRMRLNPPACEAPGGAIVNPCSTTVVNYAERFGYPSPATTCTEPPPAAVVEEEKAAPAIRFRNSGLDINLVDLTYPGDAVCRGDRDGTLVGVPLVARDFQLTFRTLNGYVRSLIQTLAAVVFPVNVVRGPDNTVWVVDEGRVQTLSERFRGRLHRFNPATGSGFVIQ